MPTLGELMKLKWPASLNVAVAGKDRAAVMMGGHVADQRWYWDGKQFATDRAAGPAPRTIVRLNQAIGPLLAAPSEGLDPPPFCAARSQVVAIEGGGKPVGGGRLARAAGDAAAFRASPAFDGAVLAASAGLIQELALGTHPQPDLISVGLSATDYVGHTYGTGGQEMCLQLLELDREIGDFLAQLDRWHLDYAVVLTADHGGLDIPERLRAQGVADAARIDPALTPRNVGEAVTKQTGIAGPILANVGVTGDLYLDSAPSGRGPPARARCRASHLPRPSAGRGGFLQGRACPHLGAGGRSGRLVDRSAGPRLVRSRTLGRSLCRAEAARHADRGHQRVRRHARQPL